MLMFVDCFARRTPAAASCPLRLSDVPAAVAPGQSVLGPAEEFTTCYDAGDELDDDDAGAGRGRDGQRGGATATTGADGTAQLTLSTPGPVVDRRRPSPATCARPR